MVSVEYVFTRKADGGRCGVQHVGNRWYVYVDEGDGFFLMSPAFDFDTQSLLDWLGRECQGREVFLWRLKCVLA